MCRGSSAWLERRIEFENKAKLIISSDLGSDKKSGDRVFERSRVLAKSGSRHPEIAPSAPHHLRQSPSLVVHTSFERKLYRFDFSKFPLSKTD